MIKISVDNVYATLDGTTKEIDLLIWSELSFEVQAFQQEHTQRRHLYNRKSKKTYSGLVDYVIKILEEEGEPYELIDNRVAYEQNADFSLVENIDIGGGKTVPLSFRPYQKQIVEGATERECVQAATGAGKTFMMAALIAKFNVKPVSVFADKLSLCTQIKEEFEKFLGRPIGIVGGGMNQIEDITVYSVQSATEEMVKDSKMIMFDECLKYDQKVLMANGSYKKIGDLVKEKSNELVMSYNHKTNKLEPKPIISHSETPLKKNNKKLMKLTIRKPDGTKEVIECTDNHKIWVESLGKYVEVRDLVKGQLVKIFNENKLLNEIVENIEYVELTEEEYNDTMVYDIGVENNHNFICENTLVHNCHHLPSNTMSQVSQWSKNAYYRIGVSATPWRDAGDDLLIEAILRKRRPENSINASKLIDLGYLVPATIYFVPIKQIFKNKNYHKLYTEAIVNNEERNEAVVKIALKMKETKNTNTLILIQRVEHGQIIQDKIAKRMKIESKTVTIKDPKNGKDVLVRVKNVEFLSGQDDAIRRKAVIQSVKDGFTSILIGSTIADEGLDIPRLDCLILAGGGRSSTRAFQRVGRVIRLYTNPETGKSKERAIVFDFQDYTPVLRRHARVREKLYSQEPRWDIKYFNPRLLDE